jgi:multidrug efflux pump subunit AcrB
MKKIFFHIPVVVTLLLVCSLIEAIFFLPSHMAHTKINIKKKNNYKINFFKNFEKLYEKLLTFSLKHKFKTILIFVLVLLLSFFILSRIKFLFFDEDDSLRCFIEYELPKGSTLEATSKKIKEVESILSKLSKDEVKSYVTVIGEDKSEAANYGEIILQGNYFANTILYLTPRENRRRTAKEIITHVKKEVTKIKGFTKIEADLVDEGPPVGKAVDVSFISNDDKARIEIAEDFKRFLQEQKGVTNIEDNVDIGKKQIAIKFDYDLLSRNGLDPLRIADTIRVAFNGIVATDLKWEGEEVDFRVILDESSRSLNNTVKELTVQKVQSLTVLNNRGNLIPIGKFIELDEKDDVLRINHIFGDRAVSVYADIDNTISSQVEVTKEIKKIYSKKILEYPGMQMKIGGEADEVNEAMNNLKIAVILALIGIYFILVILFNSFTQPLLVMLAIPFSFAGVIYTFFIHGMALTLPALIGFLGLMGVVVNDSLVMISFINKSRDSDKSMSIDSLVKAAKNRLRPIFLTTVTTAAALFPLAYGFGGYNMFASPMVMAIAWGLVFATLVTLILIPSLYLTLYNLLRHDKKKS